MRSRRRRPAFKTAAGAGEPWRWTWIDDGHLDIVTTNGWEIANGAGFPEWEYERTYLFHNDGDLTFTEVAAARGLHHTGQGRGLVHFDSDNDGDQDLAIFTKDKHIKLFRNDLDATDRHWLRVRSTPARVPIWRPTASAHGSWCGPRPRRPASRPATFTPAAATSPAPSCQPTSASAPPTASRNCAYSGRTAR